MRLRLWHLYALIPFYLGLAIWDYVDLTKFEAEGGTRRVHRLKAFLYDLGGKWAVVGFWLLIGLFIAGIIVLVYRRERELRRIERAFALPRPPAPQPPPPEARPSPRARPAPGGSWRPPAPPSATRPAEPPALPAAPSDPSMPRFLK